MTEDSLEINSVAQNYIDRITIKCAKIKPLVVINCITYNHEKYLRDALEGFIMQKTDFPFVALVHEDASTDKTADILREYAKNYPDIILPIYEIENQYSKSNGFVSHIMREACIATGAKYIAYCDGDDYWIDPLKLQKQVDYLESHTDYSLVCSHSSLYNAIEKKYSQYYRPTGTFDINFLISDNIVVTCTCMVRLSCIKSYHTEIGSSLRLPFGDYQLWLYSLTKGKGIIIKDITTVYRVSPQGVSHYHTTEEAKKWMHGTFDIVDFFCKYFDIEDDAKKIAYFKRYKEFAYKAAIWNDKSIYKRALGFYRKKGFWGTVFFLKTAHFLPWLEPLWTYFNNKNRIILKVSKTYDTNLKW